MLLQRLIGENVTFEVVHGRDLWPVKADVSQFEQVIVNLVVNARDAMPNGGKLAIRTAQCHRRGGRGVRLQGNAGRRLCAGRDRRHRHRHSARDHREDFRAVFHHQGGGQGHRARPVDGLRHRQADRRFHLRRLQSGRGHDVSYFPAAPPSRSRGAAGVVRRDWRGEGAFSRGQIGQHRSDRPRHYFVGGGRGGVCVRSMPAACVRAATA